MALLLFCLIVTLALCSGSTIFAGFGTAICHFMFGTFGYGCFFVVFLFACLGVWLTFEKRIKIKLRPAFFMSLTVFVLFLLFHSVSTGTRGFTVDADYVSACYDAAATGEFSSYTFGGVVSAAFVYPVAAATTFIGAYIIFSLLAVLCGYFTVKSFIKHYGKVSARPKAEKTVAVSEAVPAGNAAEVAGDAQYAADVLPAQQYVGADGQAVPEQGYGGQEQQYPAEGFEQPRYARPAEGFQGNYLPDYRDDAVYDDGTQGGQYAASVQSYADPYAEYLRNQEAYNRAISGNSSSSDDRYSPENLGRQIIFDRDEFAAESYRRNGIFDESSYFNHPVKSSGNSGSYINGFSSGKQSAGTKIEPVYNGKPAGSAVASQPATRPASIQQAPSQSASASAAEQPQRSAAESASPATYTAAYQKSVSSQPTPSVPGVIYGDAPVSKLFDEPEESAVPLTDGPDDYSSEQIQGGIEDAPETDFDVSDELEPRPADIHSGGDIPSRESVSDIPARERDIDRALFGTDRGREDVSFPRRNGDGVDDGRFSSGDEPRREISGNERSDDRSLRPADKEPDRRIVGFGEPSESTRGGISDEGRGGSAGGLFPSRGQPSSSDGPRAGGLSSLFSASNSRLGESRIEPDSSRLSVPRRSNADLFDEPDDDESLAARDDSGRAAASVPLPARNVAPVSAEPVAEKSETEQKAPHVWKKYMRPPLDLLEDYPENCGADSAEIEASKRIIVETLVSFRVECEVMDVIVAPALTRYDIAILDRTNIKPTLLRYKESIAMALKRENVNAYLNFAKGALSIEVPNAKHAKVGLKGMMRSAAYNAAKPSSLTFALGKNLDGACVCPDIRKMPHLLVAGTSGSGKSVCLNSLLLSLLYKYGPEDLRLILVDPKQVEFISYDKLPHLMINEIILDIDKAIKALNWAIKEMERRYGLFKDMTETGTNAKDGKKIATKEIDEYNAHIEAGVEKLPKILIVLDEFGDLMLQAKKDIEQRIIRLVQKGRAAGIHLILATQRPSVDCITGLIKSNLPARIGFKVGSFDDSRTIFDKGGAEKLLGMGDMYYRAPERPEPLQRIQGCFVDTLEVQRVTDYIKEHNETYFDQSVSDFINTVEEPAEQSGLSDGSDGGDESKIDDTYIRALKFCVTSNAASVSMIQRRFPIGYMKACKIIDWMENMNYVTKSEGSKARKVLLSYDEFVNTYGDVDD